jgi:hypothetical protein
MDKWCWAWDGTHVLSLLREPIHVWTMEGGPKTPSRRHTACIDVEVKRCLFDLFAMTTEPPPLPLWRQRENVGGKQVEIPRRTLSNLFKNKSSFYLENTCVQENESIVSKLSFMSSPVLRRQRLSVLGSPMSSMTRSFAASQQRRRQQQRSRNVIDTGSGAASRGDKPHSPQRTLSNLMKHQSFYVDVERKEDCATTIISNITCSPASIQQRRAKVPLAAAPPPKLTSLPESLSIKCSSPSSQSNKKRRVRFNDDDEPYVIPRRQHEEDDCYQRWCTWLSQEYIAGLEKEASDTVCCHLRSRPEYFTSACHLLLQCSTLSNDAGSTQLSRISDVEVRLPIVDDDNDESVRGLERLAIPMLSIRRDRSCSSLMEYQHRLLQLMPPGATDNRAQLLALHYSRNTRYAAVWARVIADADAMMVGASDFDASERAATVVRDSGFDAVETAPTPSLITSSRE